MNEANSANPVEITHYSDVLCVWAYIAQRRVEELEASFPQQVNISYRFLQVFGDVESKMTTQWATKGGLSGYAEHVQEVAARFEHLEISPRAWLHNTPASSLPAHIALCGIRASQPDDATAVQRALRALRHAFFVEVRNVADANTLLDVLRSADIDMDALRGVLESGVAHAGLADDLSAAATLGVRASPTLSFNEDRQLLTGNVGYRVMEANVRELLRNPSDQQSWC